VLSSPKRWDRIVQLAADLGERLPASPDAKALDELLDRRGERTRMAFLTSPYQS
jgi:exoribonuclease-2